MTEFRPGDRVSFLNKREKCVGTILRIMPNTALVELGPGSTRRVPLRRLTSHQEQGDANIIPFPVHACGVGKRVWFLLRGPRYDMPMSGTVLALNRHSTQIKPDNGAADYYWVRHPYVYRNRAEVLDRLQNAHPSLLQTQP